MNWMYVFMLLSQFIPPSPSHTVSTSLPFLPHLTLIRLPWGGSDSKEFTCNVGDQGLIPGLGRSPGGWHVNPLQCSFLENPHGERSLAGYSPCGCKELTRLKWLSTTQPKKFNFISTSPCVYTHISNSGRICVTSKEYVNKNLYILPYMNVNNSMVQ